MSAPAAKALSPPAMTIAPIPSSASNFASASPSSFISASLSAFSAFGRLRVIMPTRPRVPTMMFSYAIGVDFREEPQGEAPDFIRPPSPCPLPQAGEGMMFSRKEAVMIDPRTASLGALLLRLSLGAMFIAHASFKYFVFTLPGTARFFASVGFPGPLAYVVFAAELIGGAMLVLGVYARWVALAFVPLLLGATTVHWGNGWAFDSKGGGWEFPVFWAVVLVVQSMIGDGALALKRSSSARIHWSSCAGVPPAVSRPCSAKRAFTSGRSSIFMTSAFRRATIPGGVFAGASRPTQASDTKPG